MPIYEYRCGACGHLLDALQKISDDPLSDCPSCEQAALKRLISRPSFRLKGSGWYETDFKSDKERKRNLVETGGGADKKPDGGDKQSAGKDAKSDGKSTERKSGDGESGSKGSTGKTSSTGTEAA